MKRADVLIQAAKDLARALRALERNDDANTLLGLADVAIANEHASTGEPLSHYVTLTPGVSPCGQPCASLDRHTLTTWTGVFIAALEVTGVARGFNGSKLTCYATTIAGRRYHGRGQGPHMCITLRTKSRGVR